MDKETLSNYGWIVVLVLVLAVLLAIATPFGNFIADGFKAAYMGLFDTSNNAMGIVIPGANANHIGGIPIKWNTADVLNNTSFEYEKHAGNSHNKYVKISDSLPSVELFYSIEELMELEEEMKKLEEELKNIEDEEVAKNKIMDFYLKMYSKSLALTGYLDIRGEKDRPLTGAVMPIAENLYMGQFSAMIWNGESSDTIEVFFAYEAGEYEDVGVIPEPGVYCWDFGGWFSNVSVDAVIDKPCLNHTLYTGMGTATWDSNDYCPECGKYRYYNFVVERQNMSWRTIGYSKSLTEFVIPETFYHDSYGVWCKTIGLDEGAFSNKNASTYHVLTKITIPSTVQSIGKEAFYNVTTLTEIVFEGTVAQWNAIKFGENWNTGVPATYVQCSDGTACITHTGGTATCIQRATCNECKLEYGDLGMHTENNGTCTICGTKVTEIETAHNPYPINQNYVVLGTWDYSDAKSVDIIITRQTRGISYDWISITEGIDYVSGSSYDETRKYLNVDNFFVFETGKSSVTKLGGTDKATLRYENLDMLTGSVVFRTDKYTSDYYGAKVQIIPNY